MRVSSEITNVIIHINNFRCGCYDILRNYTLYPTTFTVGLLQFGVLIEVFTAILNHFGWSSISLVQEVKTRTTFYDDWLKGSGENSKVKFMNIDGVPVNIQQYRIVTQPYSSAGTRNALLDASKYSRSKFRSIF